MRQEFLRKNEEIETLKLQLEDRYNSYRKADDRFDEYEDVVSSSILYFIEQAKKQLDDKLLGKALDSFGVAEKLLTIHDFKDRNLRDANQQSQIFLFY